MSVKSNRPTQIRTFRFYKDQVNFIESTNSDCASMFMRFLLDAWMSKKIPREVMKEWFQIRKEFRQRAEQEELKQLILNNQKVEEQDEI